MEYNHDIFRVKLLQSELVGTIISYHFVYTGYQTLSLRSKCQETWLYFVTHTTHNTHADEAVLFIPAYTPSP